MFFNLLIGQKKKHPQYPAIKNPVSVYDVVYKYIGGYVQKTYLNGIRLYALFWSCHFQLTYYELLFVVTNTNTW